MKLNHNTLLQVVLIIALLLTGIVQIHNFGKERKTARIIETIDLLQKQRLIDSINYRYVVANVDSLKARTAAQQAEIITLKGTLWNEKKTTRELEKSLNDLLYIINDRPIY